MSGISVLTLRMRRARELLTPRAELDAEAAELLHEVCAVLTGIRLLEHRPPSPHWQQRAERVAARAAAMHARMLEYCERHRLAYMAPERGEPA